MDKNIGFALVVALIASVVVLYFDRFDRISTENIRAFIISYGIWAPGVFGIVYLAFLMGTLIGTTPGTFSLVYLGDSLTNLGPNKIWRALGLNAATFLVPVLVLINRGMRKKLQQGIPEENRKHLSDVNKEKYI